MAPGSREGPEGQAVWAGKLEAGGGRFTFKAMEDEGESRKTKEIKLYAISIIIIMSIIPELLLRLFLLH